MPDILKSTAHDGASVKIPDVNFGQPLPEPVAEGTSEPLPDAVSEPLPESAPPPEPLTREELIELYRPELEKIRAEEACRAYTEERTRKAGEMKQCIGEVEQRMQELEEQQRAYMMEYAKQLKFLSIEIAEKLVNQKISENDLALQKLVLNTVGKVKNASWMNVEISDRLVELIGRMKEELARPEYHGAAEITPVGAPDGTVRVTTDNGTIDASIATQAQNLREIFTGMEQKG